MPSPGLGVASRIGRSFYLHFSRSLEPLPRIPGDSLVCSLPLGGHAKSQAPTSSRKPPLYLWHSDPRAFPTPDPGSQTQPGTPRVSHLRALCARPVAPAAVCAPSRGPRHIRGAVRDFSLPSPSSSGQPHLHPALPGARRRQGATDFKPFPCRLPRPRPALCGPRSRHSCVRDRGDLESAAPAPWGALRRDPFLDLPAPRQPQLS